MSGRRAREDVLRRRPRRPRRGDTRVTSIPSSASRAAASRIDGCSMAEITRCPRRPARRARSKITALLASVPEAVNTTSGGRPPISAATSSRAASTASRAPWPKRWTRGRVAVQSPAEPGEHRLARPGVERGRGVVVEVDEVHGEGDCKPLAFDGASAGLSARALMPGRQSAPQMPHPGIPTPGTAVECFPALP